MWLRYSAKIHIFADFGGIFCDFYANFGGIFRLFCANFGGIYAERAYG